MEYYAKSKKIKISKEKIGEVSDKIEQLLCILDGDLDEWEKRALQQAKEDLSNCSEEKQKTLKEHLDETVSCAKRFFDIYGSYFSEKEKILLENACRYHDIGKVNVVFQNIVAPKENKKQSLNGIPQIPHGYLSAISLSKKEFLKKYPEMTENDFYIMVTAIYYHHAREDDSDSLKWNLYCEKYYNENARIYLGDEYWRLQIENLNHILFKKNQTLVAETEKWNEYLLVKGLLNKFDWAVSGGKESAEQYFDLDKRELANKVENRLENKLRPAQIYMRNHKNENLVIVAPTGSGKTEAALLWLDGKKGFYTLPLKVSSDAIYERVREQYSYDGVSLLHSDSMSRYYKESYINKENDGYEKYERAKLLSSPLTICTVDQLFKFVYKALGTEIFPATLKYSKLILDEIQAYEPRVVASVLYGLKTIIAMGGHFAIITATLPPVLQRFMEKYGIIEGKEYLKCDFTKESELKRHIVEMRDGEIDIDNIVEQGKIKKILVICNTVKRAQDVYEEIKNVTNKVHLLHSRFIRRDRRALEKEIMRFSGMVDETGIWVTTQIVEASLDIDFDMLFTEMVPADSLLQRMGRCNRSGRYIPVEANIIVYNNKNGVSSRDSSIYDEGLYMRSVELLKRYENNIFSEKDKTEYINKVYDSKEIETTKYYEKIEEYMAHLNEVHPLEYSKEEVNKKFRNIDSITVVPDSVHCEHYKIFETCGTMLQEAQVGKVVRSILKSKINDFTLSLNLINQRYPEGVDRATIKGTDIHMANLCYDFDYNNLEGKGLILGKKEEEEFLEC